MENEKKAFTSLTLQCRYRSGDATAKPLEFYNRVLPLCKNYSRAVGFFSSTSLIEISRGICSMICNGGKLRLITSPRLSEEDIAAIEKGYKAKEEIILQAMKRSMLPPQNIDEENRLNILANMIESGFLDIKIAMTENPQDSMYHEKIGIFEDEGQNSIVITGSNNESATAQTKNFESFDVYCSWSQKDNERIAVRKNDFERMWNNEQNGLEVSHFPKFSKKFVEKYKATHVDFRKEAEKEKIEMQKLCEKENLESVEKESNLPAMPDWLKLHDYQKEAIDTWQENNFHGIFDMATGTGKTLTALAALVRLYESTDQSLAVIIVVPYQHLVEQWVEDIKKFNITPIICYSESSQKNWKDKLREERINLGFAKPSKKFLCFICTNATFSSSFVQDNIKQLYTQKFLLVDEAHNFGASYLKKLLHDFYDFRLALSATINRHGDTEGSNALFNFFGQKCIEYDIERAIKEGKLTVYNYHPIIVCLTEDELGKYKTFSNEISTCIIKDKHGKISLTERGKILVMERARLIAGAKNKIATLKKYITPYKNDTHILIYCGAAKTLSENAESTEVDETEERQITTISKLLGNELNMKCHHFTSNETASEREKLKKEFSSGSLQALVAIKCLDEGVNIPKIKTAFILASTTNPKEYIQRRGRVLRLAEGKEFAEIYDFITLPYDLDAIHSLSEVELKNVLSLAKRELLRAEEFARVAKNYFEAENMLDEIRDVYNVNEKELSMEDELHE